MTPRNQDRRRSSRLKLAPMYTMIRVQPQNDGEHKLSGHIYDVSETGLRIELDDPLPIGQTLTFNALLPGKKHATIAGSGRIVRHHNPDNDPGPIRMGLVFERLDSAVDQQNLTQYLTVQHKAVA